MKTKLTVTIDKELIPQVKQYARSQGVSLSHLIETTLRELSSNTGASFSNRWGGKFRPADRDDKRYRALAKKYL